MFREVPSLLKELCLISTLIFASSAVAQRNEAPASSEAQTQMLLPPPVSGVGLPTSIGAQKLSNALSGGVLVSGGYANNLYPGSGIRTVSDTTFSVQPYMSFDRTTRRLDESLRYAPTFDYYSPDTTLNTFNQSGTVAFQYRLAPHVTVLAGDNVDQTSDTWSQPLSSGSVSGGLPAATPGFIVPFAPQISNSAYGQLAWQLSPNSMVGAGGNTTLLHYTNTSQAQGLFDSNSRSGSGFYTRRFGSNQYFGGLYEYSYIVATPDTPSGPPKEDLSAHEAMAFYTVYLEPKLSISLGAGSQYYKLEQSPAAPLHAWAPIAVGSVGWQAQRASFALTYSHLVTAGEGIVGAYTSDSGSLSTQLQLSPDWIATIAGTYAQLNPVTRAFSFSTPGGHTVSFNGLLERRLGPFLSLSIQYQHLHQTYDGIPSIAANPDSSRTTASISYHFTRPLGM